MKLTAAKLPSVEMGSRSKLFLREFLYSYWSVHRDGEECDAGSANGKYNSGCATDCKLCGYCGDGILDDASGEQVGLISEHESHLSMFCELVVYPRDFISRVKNPRDIFSNPPSILTCHAILTPVFSSVTWDIVSRVPSFPSKSSWSVMITWPYNACFSEHSRACSTDFALVLNGSPGANCSANCTLQTCEYKCGNGVVSLNSWAFFLR